MINSSLNLGSRLDIGRSVLSPIGVSSVPGTIVCYVVSLDLSESVAALTDLPVTSVHIHQLGGPSIWFLYTYLLRSRNSQWRHMWGMDFIEIANCENYAATWFASSYNKNTCNCHAVQLWRDACVYDGLSWYEISGKSILFLTS